MFRQSAVIGGFIFRLLLSFLLLNGLSLAGISPANEADYLVEKWTASDGLPSSTVTGLARTQDGFLWVGTDKGLARFDGARFTTFTSKNLPGLRSDQIENMGAGPDSQIYIGTWGGGFSILNHGHARHFGKAEGIKGVGIPVVLPVGQDEAWFGTDAGYLYHYRNTSIEEIGTGSLPRAAIYGLASTSGTLWIGTQNGLFSLTGDKVSRYQPKVAIPGDGIFDLAVTHSGQLFASNDSGLFEIRRDSWRRWTTKNGLPSNKVQVLLAAPDNALWIGTDMGVARFDQEKIEAISTPLCPAGVLSLDPENSLWVACGEGKGLLRLRQPPVRMLSLSGNLQGAGARSLAEDKGDVIWIATQHGLVRWKNKRFTVFTEKDGLPDRNVGNISLASDGVVWIGTNNGFAKMKNGKIESFRTRGLGPEDPINPIVQDRSGSLWVGASEGLLLRRRGETHFEQVKNVTGLIWSIREDRAGNIWAATKYHGLIRFSGGSQTIFTSGCGLASNMVYDLAEADDGDVWVATEAGLSRIRGGKCASIGAENGLPPERVIAVAPDRRGDLWLVTTSAVVGISLDEVNRVADHGGKLVGVRMFGHEDGFGEQLSGFADCNAVLTHSSGEMWFATLAGIGRLNPKVLQTPAPVLKPQVFSVVSDVGQHDLTQRVLLRPGDRHLQFTYGAASLIGAKTREFRYRLTGFDNSWQVGNKQRDAVYTSLRPGRYTFEVSGRRPFEPWSGASKALEILILPYFYQTWWWYSLLAIALLSLVIVGHQLRLVALRKEYATLMAERLRERSRLSRELHDVLAQRMTGIHIQIEAAQVLLDADPSSVRSHLETVERLARESSVETRNAIAALRSEAAENAKLGHLLQTAASRFSGNGNIPLAAILSDDLPDVEFDTGHEIVRIIEEALANVRLHSGAHHAYLIAQMHSRAVQLEVRDDGVGFDFDASRSATKGHFGIAGMKERAKRIGARFQITTGLGKGTRVTLELPLRNTWKASILVPQRFLAAMWKRASGGNRKISVAEE